MTSYLGKTLGMAKRRAHLLVAVAGNLLLPAVAWPASAMAGIVECMPRRTVEVMLRIDSDAVPAVLQLAGGSSPALRLMDPHTGALRWSAAATNPASQVFPDMRAGFTGSLAAVDLDGDGLHDRIYAGDLAGRLWRFDIHQGKAPEALMTGGIFASLGGTPVVRAFLAPPDVSFWPLEGKASSIHVAIGSASLWQGQERNRFYVLRDRAAFEVWSAEDYRRWRPLTEADLVWSNDPARAATGALPDPLAGFYVTLEHGSIVLPSITVSARAVMAVAEDLAGAGEQCSVGVIISSVSLEDGRLIHGGNGNGEGELLRLPGRIPSPPVFDYSRKPAHPRPRAVWVQPRSRPVPSPCARLHCGGVARTRTDAPRIHFDRTAGRDHDRRHPDDDGGTRLSASGIARNGGCKTRAAVDPVSAGTALCQPAYRHALGAGMRRTASPPTTERGQQLRAFSAGRRGRPGPSRHSPGEPTAGPARPLLPRWFDR